MMKKILILTMFLFLSQTACRSVSDETAKHSLASTNKTSEIINGNARPEATETSFDRSEISAQMFYKSVYADVLNGVFDEGVFEKDLNGVSVVYKRETVTPFNVEKLRTLPGIQNSTVEKFIERNATTEKLPNGFDIARNISGVDEKDTYESLQVLESKQTGGKTSIIGMSKSGYNKDFTQAVVYVEYFGLDKDLQKKYVLINWKSFPGDIKDKNWFPAE